MSLSSFLLSSQGKGTIDEELDALFTAKSQSLAQPAPSPSPKKRKTTRDNGVSERKAKRSKTAISKEIEITCDPEPTVALAETRKKSKKTKSERKQKKLSSSKGKKKSVGSEDENGEDQENATTTVLIHDDRQRKSDGNSNSLLVHESLTLGKKKSNNKTKMKFVPPDETPERRNERTIFIGNLPTTVAEKRPLLRQLHRHILAEVPLAKIESTRFRSVPFQAPTSKPDTEDATKPKPKSTTHTGPSSSPSKQARPHDVDRTSAWRQRQADDADDSVKTYLTPSQKKKIAFINHEFHSTADVVNAYIVFAYPIPSDDRPSNLPPLPPVMDPYEAACLAATRCDGTVFMERTIRVDLVGKKHQMNDQGLLETDPKLSVFVGNLDFASKEEDLRVFFDGVISAERGPPEPEVDSTDEGSKRSGSWVARVRIVRDKDTQLGKGFAYVQFVDRECVDEILAMEQGKLKFAKRKLRVRRCKTVPSSSVSITGAASEESKKHVKTTGMPVSSAGPTVITVPKGDPQLGEKIAHMTKEERKQVKSTDVDRVARRLAKKKARMAMESKGSGVKVKVTRKERERVRKPIKSGRHASGSKKAGGEKKKVSGKHG